MKRCEIDHLVVTASDLESGVRYVEGALGISLQPGGKHVKMGTHNALLKLSETTYLEVIAPDPGARPPGQPRWFELDRAGPPRLATWVARTTVFPDLFGPVEEMSRGDLEWLITIPPDGRLTLGGVAPPLIQWKSGRHPASRLPDAGCSLLELQLLHPEPDRVLRVLKSIGAEMSVERADRPQVRARLETKGGERLL